MAGSIRSTLMSPNTTNNFMTSESSDETRPYY